MTATTIREKLINEIQLIPDHHLLELYSFLHYYRLGLKQAKSSDKNNQTFTMQFAGCWENMSDKEYNDLMDDMQQRRQNAFSGRGEREILFD